MYLDRTKSLEEIVAAIVQQTKHENDLALVLVGEENPPDVTALIARLNARNINFMGGIFPGIIHGEQSFREGLVVRSLPALAPPFVVSGLDKDTPVLPDFGENILQTAGKKYTALILVDGHTSNIALLLSEIFNRGGDAMHYLGGGAGSLNLRQAPCVFSKHGFAQDTALIAFVQLESHLGVRHGWQKIMGPIVATKTRKNLIVELNWRNAFDVYRDTVERDAGKPITPENFFDVAKGYPFGIFKEGEEDLVRDPIAVNERGELICVGEVPENTVLYILKGDRAALIQAAGQAVEDCHMREGQTPRHTFIVDCISRTLFLEENFPQELELVNRKFRGLDSNLTPFGMLSLGEISSYGEGFVEFFNKTIVIGVLYE